METPQDSIRPFITYVRYLAAFVVSLALAVTALCTRGMAEEPQREEISSVHSHAIDVSPVSPFLNIYAIQYSYRGGENDDIMIGLAYANIKYWFGYASSDRPSDILSMGMSMNHVLLGIAWLL